MVKPEPNFTAEIPTGLRPYFQEYEPAQLNFRRDANLIVQRTLEFGTWDEVRWLFEVYGAKRIRLFLHQYGERWLNPVTFHYWCKLLRVRKWRSSWLPTSKGELWSH